MSTNNDQEDQQKNQATTKNTGAISKANNKKLNQILVTRNPSVTSSQLNAAAPLVRITRVPSNKSTISDALAYRSADTNVTARKPVKSVKSTKADSPNAFKNFFTKSNDNFRSKIGSKLYPFIDLNGDAVDPQQPDQPGLRRVDSASSSKTTGSKPSSTHSSKSNFYLPKPTREAPEPPAPADNVTLRSDRNKENRLTRPSTKSTFEPEVLTVKSDRNKENKSIRPNTLALSQAKPQTRRYINNSQQQQKPIPAARRPPQTLFESLTKKRGQAPSGSKGVQPGQQIKGASSVSSLDDNLSTKQSSKSSKFGSKDKLDHIVYNKGSKEKLVDVKQPKDKTKRQQQQLPPSAQMPIQEQDTQQYHLGNNNVMDQRSTITSSTFTSEPSITKDQIDNFDGHKQQQQLEQITRPSRMQELQSQIDKLHREKLALEDKVVELSSYQKEVVALRNEITKMQASQEINSNELHRLLDENESLRGRLKNVVQSPLSDAEKQQIIDESQRLHNSAPASMAIPNTNDIEGTTCSTPEWDKHSTSSEISVACLQDKIIQMEETHYSTNEELQATLQELADLQSQILELQSDNERLAEEKDVIFQSLCRQTEKLEDTRSQIGTLQKLLLRDPTSQDGNTTEREQKLVDLLKNAQDERENMMQKQEELHSELHEMRNALQASATDKSRMRERIGVLDSTIDAANAEKKEIELQLMKTKEDSSAQHIEISRLSTLLENARCKIDELEQDRARSGDKSDLSELLDVARKEKDALEIQVASLQEQLSKSQCEIQKLKDQLAGLTEECKVTRNNAKCALSDLEYKNEQIEQEKQKVLADYQSVQDTANELQVQNKCLLEDKMQLENLLSETQRHLGETERMLSEKDDQLNEEIKLRKQECEEWEQFQSDLLMTVRVANDFKTEAQHAHEQLVMDNKGLRERIRAMEGQIEKLNKLVTSSETQQQSIINSVQQEMAVRRQKASIVRQDSRLSVKSLIESIEKSATQANVTSSSRCSSSCSLNSFTSDASPKAKVTSSSRCSSSSSLNSFTSDVNSSPTQNGNGTPHQNGTNNHNNNHIHSSNNNINNNENSHDLDKLHTPVISSVTAKSPLREQQQTIGTNLSSNQKINTDPLMLIKPSMINSNSSNNNNSNQINNNFSHHLINNHHGLINGNNKQVMKQQSEDPYVTSILSHKTIQMDFTRRNSYGDLCERKDPLNALVKNGGSKRNALLKWCQNKTVGYRNIDITNFSSSWNDGLAFCAIMHSYLPDRVPYDSLTPVDKRRNFSLAFTAAESVGIITSLNINEMCQLERPDWQQVMAYVTSIYKHYET